MDTNENFLSLAYTISSTITPTIAIVDDLRTFTNSTGGVVIFPDSEGVSRSDAIVGRFTTKASIIINYFELADNNYNAGASMPELDTQFVGCRIRVASTAALVAEGTVVGPNKCSFTSIVLLNNSVTYTTNVDKNIGVSRFMASNTTWPAYAGDSFRFIVRNGTNIIFNGTGGITGSEYDELMTVSSFLNSSLSICTGTTGSNHITYNLLREEDGMTQQSNNYVDVEAFINVTSNLTGSIFSSRISNTTNFSICFDGTNQTFDFHLTYSQESPDYSNRYYDNKVAFAFGGTNWTRNIYNLNDTSVAAYSILSITLRKDNDFDYFKDVYAKLDKKYPSTGQWRTVQMSRSDELGLLTFKIKEQDTEYRIYFYDANNNLILFTTPLKFIDCSTGTCTLTYLLNPDFLASIGTPSFTFTSSYNNVSGVIYVNWTESTGLSDYVTVNVTRETATGSVQICSNTTNTSIGHVGCNVAGQTGLVYVVAKSHLNASNVVLNQYSVFYEVVGTKLFGLVGKYEGGLWSFGIATTASMFGLFSPVGAIISVIIGLIFIFALGIFSPINITFIIVATAIAIAIGIKLKD